MMKHTRMEINGDYFSSLSGPELVKAAARLPVRLSPSPCCLPLQYLSLAPTKRLAEALLNQYEKQRAVVEECAYVASVDPSSEERALVPAQFLAEREEKEEEQPQPLRPQEQAREEEISVDVSQREPEPEPEGGEVEAPADAPAAPSSAAGPAVKRVPKRAPKPSYDALYYGSPFQCPACALGYRRRGFLLRHVERMHPELKKEFEQDEDEEEDEEEKE